MRWAAHAKTARSVECAASNDSRCETSRKWLRKDDPARQQYFTGWRRGKWGEKKHIRLAEGHDGLAQTNVGQHGHKLFDAGQRIHGFRSQYRVCGV